MRPSQEKPEGPVGALRREQRNGQHRGCRSPGGQPSRGREEGSQCLQQGRWRLDLGVYFLPTMSERPRRESTGS